MPGWDWQDHHVLTEARVLEVLQAEPIFQGDLSGPADWLTLGTIRGKLWITCHERQSFPFLIVVYS